jgi:hypothetical protein
MVGKEKIIVVVLIALSVGTLISALSTTLPVMLVGRVIQGTGGAVFPLAFGIIRDEFPSRAGPPAPSASCRPSSAIGRRRRHHAGRSHRRAPLLPLALLDPLVMTVTATVATFIFVPESPVRSPGRINWLGASSCRPGW